MRKKKLLWYGCDQDKYIFDAYGNLFTRIHIFCLCSSIPFRFFFFSLSAPFWTTLRRIYLRFRNFLFSMKVYIIYTIHHIHRRTHSHFHFLDTSHIFALIFPFYCYFVRRKNRQSAHIIFSIPVWATKKNTKRSWFSLILAMHSKLNKFITNAFSFRKSDRSAIRRYVIFSLFFHLFFRSLSLSFILRLSVSYFYGHK